MLKPKVCVTLRIRREHRASRGVHVAEDRRDEQQGSGVVDAVEVVREALRREREGAGAFGVHAGRGHDVGGGHAGDLLGLFRGEGLAVGGKLFKAVAPLLDELAIVEAFLYDRCGSCPWQARCSVPTRGARWMSASSAAFVRRVSTVMIQQPRALALTRDSHQPSGCAQTFVAMIMKERVFSVGMAPVDGQPR